MTTAADSPVSPRPSADSGDPPKPQLHPSAAVQQPPMDPSTVPVRPADPALATPSSSDAGQPLKPNACISCQRRKVKCDRLEPCSSCKRYRAVCEFRDPAPRRKRKLSDEDLHAKLDRYESILNSFVSGFTPLNAPRPQPQQDSAVSTPRDATPARPSTYPTPQNLETGRLIFEKGNSRYLESSLWKGISDELTTPGDMLRNSSSTAPPEGRTNADAFQFDASELVLGLRAPPGNLRHLHPQPPHIFLLWQAFLDNINPLTKLLHAPTVQRQILRAASNLDSVDAETEVLMFAIYTFSVTSLGQEECQSSFGESKDDLLRRFHELNPDMKQLPVEHTGPTEMFFCLLRYNLGKFMRRSCTIKIFEGDSASYWDANVGPWPNLQSAEVSLIEKDKAINELEKSLEEQFLKHCDPSVPLHYITAIVARCALSVMRLLAHHPRQYSDKGKSLPQSEKDFLFQNSLKIVELDNLSHMEPSLQRFMWHMDAFFQWEGFIYVLSELRTRISPTDKDVEKAWFEVNKTLNNHSDILDISRSPLHLAVASVATKAWDAYAAEAVRQGRPPPSLQDHGALEVLVTRLRDLQGPRSVGGGAPHEHDQPTPSSSASKDTREAANARLPDGQYGAQKAAAMSSGANGWSMPMPPALDASPMDWAMWDDMLAEFGLGMEVFGGYTASGSKLS
ncbi:hypothetical protein GTA08_BOTSDO11952 [Neofusicoccum parvum]|uniref:Uncharacterized protein n=1 Tax=Neofusicoccum parvum TaxID=310453 RepID=A0ACB5S906_9PEZI|nr:hypothetical protein GTA08_BOTSDO11952 [Neofusicoccum parvum]